MAPRLAGLLLTALVIAGCGHPFPTVKSVSELEPDERVVIGQIAYADGDINDWVKGSFEKSWPLFSYDLDTLYGPRPALGETMLDPRGGAFAVRVQKGTAYLYSIAVETKSLMRRMLWTFPIILELPPSADRCTFAGTIVIQIAGGPPKRLPWYALPGQSRPSGSKSTAIVYDTYDRDRAALSDRVAGCDLKKALAVEPSPEEVRALRAAAKTRRDRDAAAAESATP